MTSFTPFRIEDAQSASLSPLITARKAGVLNEKRCNKMIRQITAAENQLGSKQDIVFTHQEETLWIGAILDGHGNRSGKNPYTSNYGKFNFCVEAIKTLKENGGLCEILSAPITKDANPAILLQQALGNEAIKYKTDMLATGATLALVQVRHIEDKIKVSTLSVGDSTIIIYRNGELIYETTPHDYTNQAELDRLLQENRFKDPSNKLHDGPNFELLDDTFIVNRMGKYLNTKKITLAMTQSIGHLEYSANNQTIVEPLGALGLCPEIREFELDDTDDIKIKVFSDGVSDVTISSDREFLASSDAQETVDFATNRWKQEWKYCQRSKYEHEKDNKETIHFQPYKFASDGMDDVSCVFWQQLECKDSNEDQ